VAQGSPIQPWQSYNVSRYVIGAALTDWGACVVPLKAQKDHAAGLVSKLEMAIGHTDAVVLCGDSEQHRRTEAATAIETIDPHGIVADGLRLLPGMSTVIGALSDTPVVGIPGSSVAALLTLRVVAEPIIRRLAGKVNAPLASICTLREAIQGRRGWETDVLVHIDGTGCRAVRSITPRSSIFADANGFVRVPAATGRLSADSLVSVERIDG
jgi:molybdopterin biosynthesis enzyme